MTKPNQLNNLSFQHENTLCLKKQMQKLYLLSNIWESLAYLHEDPVGPLAAKNSQLGLEHGSRFSTRTMHLSWESPFRGQKSRLQIPCGGPGTAIMGRVSERGCTCLHLRRAQPPRRPIRSERNSCCAWLRHQQVPVLRPVCSHSAACHLVPSLTRLQHHPLTTLPLSLWEGEQTW